MINENDSDALSGGKEYSSEPSTFDSVHAPQDFEQAVMEAKGQLSSITVMMMMGLRR